jgi:hypothetical protein
MKNKRSIKRIPIIMDLLFEDFVSPEQVNDIILALSNAVSNSKHGLSKGGNKLKESRFFVKDQILIQENFIENKKSIEEF